MDLNSLKDQAYKLQEYLNQHDDNEIDYDQILQEYGLDVKSLEKEMENYEPKLDLGFVKLHPDAVEPKYNYETYLKLEYFECGLFHYQLFHHL